MLGDRDYSPHAHQCPRCGKPTDRWVCPECGFEIKQIPGDGPPRDASKMIEAPYFDQETLYDCSEVVANMIHKWRGELDALHPEGVHEFNFIGLADDVGGVLEKGPLDRVKGIVKQGYPTPIRLDGLRSGHTVLVLGYKENDVLVTHDPDRKPYYELNPDEADYTGWYIDIRGRKS